MGVDVKELLGALLQRGMSDSSQRRVETSLNDDGLAGILEREFGGSSRGAAPTQARVPVGAESGERVSTQQRPSPRPYPQDMEVPTKPSPSSGGRSIFGDSFKGALGAGALALLGAIAMKALRGGSQSGSPQAAGLISQPDELENPPEQQNDEAIANLMVKAMVNAAKVDGTIDDDELQKIVGELQSDGITQAERDFLLGEARKPLSTAEIVRAVPNRQVGAQVYAASLLAIEVDTPAEEAYLEQLARDLGLNSQVVDQIHTTLGVA
jgi:uncharacterized membrane protein YebE (DUF533 family)